MKMLSEAEALAYLKEKHGLERSVHWFRGLRRKGALNKPPPAYKLGLHGKRLMFTPKDLDSWVKTLLVRVQ